MRRCLLLLTLGLTVISSLGAQETYYLSNSIGQKLEQIAEVDLYDSAYASGYVLHVIEQQQMERVRMLFLDSSLLWKEVETQEEGTKRIVRTTDTGDLLSRRVYVDGLLREETLSLSEKRIEHSYHYDGDSKLMRISDAEGKDSLVLTTDTGMLSGMIADSYRLLIDSYDQSLALGLAASFTIIQTWPGGELEVEYQDDAPRSSSLTETLEDGFQRITSSDMESGIMTIELYDPDSNLIERRIQSIGGEAIESVFFSYDPEGRLLERTKRNSGSDEQRLVYEYQDTEEPYRTTEYLQGRIHSVTTILAERKEVRMYREGVPYALVYYNQQGEIERIEYE